MLLYSNGDKKNNGVLRSYNSILNCINGFVRYGLITMIYGGGCVKIKKKGRDDFE